MVGSQGSEFSKRDSSASSGSFTGAPPPRKGDAQVQQLFARLAQEIDEKQPANTIFFIVDFICKKYPEHLSGFAAVWRGDPYLERDRLQVIEFFRYCKLPAVIASHFTNAGFDTLETLCALEVAGLETIEKFNNARWLPGHKVRLRQAFSDIAGRVRAFRQEREKMVQLARITTGHCDHPTVMTRTNVPQPRALPAASVGPNPVPRVRALPASAPHMSVSPAHMQGVAVGGSTWGGGGDMGKGAPAFAM